MDHKFQASGDDFLKCIRCKHAPIQHTDQAVCEACPNVGPVESYGGMLLCAACMQKEKDHQSPEKQAERLAATREAQRLNAAASAANTAPVLSLNNVIDRARAVDYSVQVRTDIFNAETISIEEIKAAIMEDANIPTDQKFFKIAESLRDRQEHFQKIIFDAQNTVVESQNKQRVIQQELNVLANKLRAEEREKLKLNNPEYKPGAIKPVKIGGEKTKSLGSQKQKFDKKELITLASALQSEGLPVQWSMLQMTCVAQNMTPKQAAEFLKKTLAS